MTQAVSNELNILKLAIEQLLDMCASVQPMQLRITRKDIEPLMHLVITLEKAFQS